MCTVTVVPNEDGFRLMCNRDERRHRAAAMPPDVYRLGHRTARYPVDPESGGTWVGVNDAGVAAALLNRTIDPAAARARRPARSRGLIVPALLDADSVPDALEIAGRLDPADFDLFRLVLVQRMVAAVVTSDGRTLSLVMMNVARPSMWTSSSLGDARVEPARRRLFERSLVRDERRWLSAQARFHAHQWRRRADISVRMERPDARTVSRTLIDVSARTIELSYDPVKAA